MEEFGITKKLVTLTKTCMEDTHYQLRVEYIICETFEVNTGLKQGDSLFSILFNRALKKAIREMQRETNGIKIDQQNMQVLGFADYLNILRSFIEDTIKRPMSSSKQPVEWVFENQWRKTQSNGIAR